VYAAGTSFEDPKIIDVSSGTFTTFTGFSGKVTYDDSNRKVTFKMGESGFASTWAQSQVYRFHFLSTSGTLPTEASPSYTAELIYKKANLQSAKSMASFTP
jgi:hypothetical protein